MTRKELRERLIQRQQCRGSKVHTWHELLTVEDTLIKMEIIGCRVCKLKRGDLVYKIDNSLGARIIDDSDVNYKIVKNWFKRVRHD